MYFKYSTKLHNDCKTRKKLMLRVKIGYWRSSFSQTRHILWKVCTTHIDTRTQATAHYVVAKYPAVFRVFLHCVSQYSETFKIQQRLFNVRSFNCKNTHRKCITGCYKNLKCNEPLTVIKLKPIYRRSKKVSYQVFCHSCIKYWTIFIIISLAHLAVNL